MSTVKRTNFKTQKNADLPDNSTGLITPKKVRDTIENLADSAAFIVDEFLVNSNFDNFGQLTDGATVTTTFANKIYSLNTLATSRTSLTLNVSGLIRGSTHLLFIRKLDDADCAITLSGMSAFALGTFAELESFPIKGKTGTRIVIKFICVGSNSYLLNFELVSLSQRDPNNRGSWSTNNSLPNTGSGLNSANEEGNKWKVPIGSTWTYGDDVWPENTIIEAMIDGADAYNEFKKY